MKSHRPPKVDDFTKQPISNEYTSTYTNFILGISRNILRGILAHCPEYFVTQSRNARRVSKRVMETGIRLSN